MRAAAFLGGKCGVSFYGRDKTGMARTGNGGNLREIIPERPGQIIPVYSRRNFFAA